MFYKDSVILTAIKFDVLTFLFMFMELQHGLRVIIKGKQLNITIR